MRLHWILQDYRGRVRLRSGCSLSPKLAAAGRLQRPAHPSGVLSTRSRTELLDDLRSILKTAAATILALIPLAPSSDDGLIAASLVAVVIGGLLSSTLLALVVIPVIDNLVVELCRGGAGGGDLLTPPRSPAR